MAVRQQDLFFDQRDRFYFQHEVDLHHLVNLLSNSQQCDHRLVQLDYHHLRIYNDSNKLD